MAAGDEKIDFFDQTFLKNRLTDAPFEALVDGKPQVWKPGETKPVVRAYMELVLKQATFSWDPTEIDLPKRKLIEVTLDGTPINPAEDTFDLTLEDASPLDLINDRNLPPRYFNEKGEPLLHKEGRITGIDARRVNASRPLDKRLAEWNRPEGEAGIEEARAAAAVAER